jgi:hypothetical protein
LQQQGLEAVLGPTYLGQKLLQDQRIARTGIASFTGRDYFNPNVTPPCYLHGETLEAVSPAHTWKDDNGMVCVKCGMPMSQAEREKEPCFG